MNKFHYFILFSIIFFHACHGKELKVFVSPTGDDHSSGALIDAPKKSLASAIAYLTKSRKSSEDTIKIILLPGEYYLDETLKITTENSFLSIEAKKPGSVIIKGSKIIEGNWEVYRDGIMKLTTNVQISPYAQLYIDGKEQILARYPNYDSMAGHYHGFAADAIDRNRVIKWKRPEGAIVHAMHQGEWGDFHYEIEAVDKKGKVTLKGGHQNNRPSPMHQKYRFVENVFEELDAPGEWYFDVFSSTLYLYPFEETNLSNAKIEVSSLNHLIELRGTKEHPISTISLKGIRFGHTNRTYMEEYEPLLRSDWMIYRGAAIYIENTTNCTIQDCELSDLGGNAIFVSGYNRDIKIEENHIYNCGASAICFVGLSSSVRSPSFTYNEFVDFNILDTIKGPKSNEFPSDCFVDNNLIHDIGLVEKQTAGVEISMARNITISHNSIYDVPRAGINVSEGTWGGHIIEYNDVFNTVLETSDHGAFNSWGRDRFWHPDRKIMDQITANNPGMPYWDATNTTYIRNNRMRCDHGWDIDLDDGSSNYHLSNNLCLNGGIKLREGFYRTVENNIMVNNGFHPHVWFQNSGDVFVHNIMMTDYKDIRLDGWGKELDYNLFPDQQALDKAKQNGTDAHSKFGDPLFIDPAHGNFTVSDNSIAVELGFKNFQMDQFGVQKPELKKIAKQPEIPELMLFNYKNNPSKSIVWLGATLKTVETMGERSAAGLKEIGGVLILSIEEGSLSKTAGLQEGDVILKCEGEPITTITDLMTSIQGNNWKGELKLIVFRNQQNSNILMKTK